MTVTLVGSSRELKNRSSRKFLPAIDLVDLLVGHVGVTASPRHDARDKSLPPRKGKTLFVKNPRSIAISDSFAEDVDPFIALLRSTQRPRVGSQEPNKKSVVAAPAVSVVARTTTTVSRIGASESEQRDVSRAGHADALPPSPQHATSEAENTTNAPLPVGPAVANASKQALHANTGRRSRRKSRGIPRLTGDVADSMLRFCPALEARISDLRRDNTATAHFLNKAQAAAWQKTRRPVGELVSRNRAVCDLEGVELSLLRREEAAGRAQRRRDAAGARRKRLERRRFAVSEAMRIKHEGPSVAELHALEQAVLLEKRQRFFLVAVVVTNSAVRWSKILKDHLSKLTKYAEALDGFGENMASQRIFEVSVVRVQHFVRRCQGHISSGTSGVVAGRNKPRNKIRLLKDWIHRAHAEWKSRRTRGGIIIFDFLKDARLRQNLKAIYHFRRKVMRCQVYVRGASLITRDRLVLLGLFFSRCEVRLRERLAERVRQQVQEAAAADLEVHRQLMRLSAAAATHGSTNAAGTAGGNRWRWRKGRGGGGNDGLNELMETVAALRLKSVQEELEARSARPDIKRRLLEDLLAKVRAVHQGQVQLSSVRGGADKDGKTRCSRRTHRGGNFPEALFTVDDARKLLAPSPPPSAGAAAGVSKHYHRSGSNGRTSPEGNGSGGGELVGASSSTVAVVPGRRSANSGTKGDSRKNTRVPPMLLLKGVPEAVMCQLVLTAWKQSSPGRGDGKGCGVGPVGV